MGAEWQINFHQFSFIFYISFIYSVGDWPGKGGGDASFSNCMKTPLYIIQLNIFQVSIFIVKTRLYQISILFIYLAGLKIVLLFTKKNYCIWLQISGFLQRTEYPANLISMSIQDLKLDGNSEIDVHVRILDLFDNIGVSFSPISPIFLHVCATCSESPFNIRNMIPVENTYVQAYLIYFFS